MTMRHGRGLAALLFMAAVAFGAAADDTDDMATAETISSALATVFDFGSHSHSRPFTEECLEAVAGLGSVEPGDWVVNYNLSRRFDFIVISLEPLCERNRTIVEKAALRFFTLSALAGRGADGRPLAEALDEALGTTWVTRLEKLREG